MSKNALPAALFVSTEVHALPVSLPDGTEAEFHFRELPSVEIRRQHMAETSGDPEVRALAIARLISVGLCDANGAPVITREQAANLKPGVAGQMVDHILRVGGLLKDPSMDGLQGNA